MMNVFELNAEVTRLNGQLGGVIQALNNHRIPDADDDGVPLSAEERVQNLLALKEAIDADRMDLAEKIGPVHRQLVHVIKENAALKQKVATQKAQLTHLNELVEAAGDMAKDVPERRRAALIAVGGLLRVKRLMKKRTRQNRYAISAAWKTVWGALDYMVEDNRGPR